MYEPMDPTNDGLMNAWKWQVSKDPGVLQHDEVIDTLARAAKRHPRTVFIACHFANCCSDLDRLGALLDACPNLYADMGARFAEISPVPQFVAAFFKRYQNRLLYGTDMDPQPEMYRVTFRLLETADEHFYPASFSKYHWPMHALNLPEKVLNRIYRNNALRLFAKRKSISSLDYGPGHGKAEKAKSPPSVSIQAGIEPAGRSVLVQSPANRLQQLARRTRFWQELAVGTPNEICITTQDLTAIAAGEDDFKGRILRLEPLRHIPPGQAARHNHIGEQEIDVGVLRFNQFKSL